jgi:uncharacterized membrane protein YfcA
MGPVTHFLPEIVAVACGGILGAWLATAKFNKINDHVLERLVGLLLLGIAGILIAHAIVPSTDNFALVHTMIPRIVVGLVVGTVIGGVSSLLGVAGGELIIPTVLLPIRRRHQISWYSKSCHQCLDGRSRGHTRLA